MESNLKQVTIRQIYKYKPVFSSSFISTFSVIFKQITKDIIAHRMRSSLTAFGVIIGVGSVYVILALGDSGKANARSALLPFREGTVIVRTENRQNDPAASNENNMYEAGLKPIPQEEIIALKNAFSKTYAYAPKSDYTASIGIDDHIIDDCQIFETTADYYHIAKLKLLSGRFITPTDIQSAVLAVDKSGRFHGLAIPVLHKKLYIDGMIFIVVGTIEKSIFSSEVPDIITTFSFSKQRNISSILLCARNKGNINLLRSVKSFLKIRCDENMEAVLAENDIVSMLETYESIVKLLALISTISLVVGCIGVMNTLVASVKEKTFEIGVRSAIGASPQLIFIHFLGEAILLCSAAGVVGLFFGAILLTIIELRNNIAPVFTITPVLISIGSATAIGISGGLIPSLQAARLNTWEALHKG